MSRAERTVLCVGVVGGKRKVLSFLAGMQIEASSSVLRQFNSDGLVRSRARQVGFEFEPECLLNLLIPRVSSEQRCGMERRAPGGRVFLYEATHVHLFGREEGGLNVEVVYRSVLAEEVSGHERQGVNAGP